MRILLDTNILIYRESNQKLTENLQRLLNLVAKHSVNILIHPLAETEIRRDDDAERRAITLSKIKVYPAIPSPPDPETDVAFRSVIRRKTSPNELVDDNLVYCVVRNAVDFLITNDLGIKAKAQRLAIAERVFDIDEALEFLQREYRPFEATVLPYSIQNMPLHSIKLGDPFFDTLKSQYPLFSDWYDQKSREGRTAWIFERSDKSIGAFLMLKDENEPITLLESILPAKKRVKLATFKVDEHGHKIGELFIKLAVEFAVSLNASEMYLTAFESEGTKFLIPLIREFGFESVGTKPDGELVFTKQLRPETENALPESLLAYYPSLYDGPTVNKYLIPIQPSYHQKLFPEWEKRTSAQLPLFPDILVAEGNSIKKAYLCHSMIKKIKPNDLLLFYRSDDVQQITSVGVVEQIHVNQDSLEEVLRLTSKRTVFNSEEIKAQLGQPLLVIIFRWHFHFSKPISYEFLKQGILNGPPQSILELSHEKYEKIKKAGELNESYTFH